MHLDVFKNRILPLKDQLFRFAMRVLNDTNETEDILQDAMLKIWSKRVEWEHIDNIEGYCYRMVKNLVWDRIQSKDYQNESYEVHMHDKFDVENPFSTLIQEEQIKFIHKLINELPEPQRSAMQLRDIEGLPYIEIAEILDTSESQVKNHLFRGRKRIKQLFEEIYNYEQS